MFCCWGGESKLTQMILEEECCSLLPAWLKLGQQTWHRILNLLSDHLTVKRTTKTTTMWLMRSYKHDQSKKEYVRLSIRNGLFNFWWGEKSGQFLLNKNFIFHHQQHIPLLEFLNMPIIQIPKVDGICTIVFPYFSSTNFFCNGPILPPQNLNGPFLKKDSAYFYRNISCQ